MEFTNETLKHLVRVGIETGEIRQCAQKTECLHPDKLGEGYLPVGEFYPNQDKVLRPRCKRCDNTRRQSNRYEDRLTKEWWRRLSLKERRAVYRREHNINSDED